MGKNGQHCHRLIIFLLCLQVSHYVHGYTFTLPVELFNSTTRNGITTPSGYGMPMFYALQWGVEYGLRTAGRQDIDFDYILFDSEFLASKGVEFVIDTSERGQTLIAGNALSAVLEVTGQAAGVYDIAQLSTSASSSAFSNKMKYPYVSRNCAADPLTVGGTAAMIVSLYEQYGRGWENIAILCSSEAFGLSLSTSLIADLEGTPINVVTFQQILVDEPDVSVEMREILRSEARVIVFYGVTGVYPDAIREAVKQGLIDEHHVWFVGSSAASTSSAYTFPNGTIAQDVVEAMRGFVGSRDYLELEGAAYDDLEKQWIGAGRPGGELDLFQILSYDTGLTVALSVIQAYDEGLLDDGKQPRASEWSRIIRGLSFDGATGHTEFTDEGDRLLPTAIVNFRPETLTWPLVGLWTVDGGLVMSEDEAIVWYDNTTNIPDLDLRPPLTYWSCHDRKMKYDPTGKAVETRTPDADDVDEIDEDYHCDNFIDCHNFSDESLDCGANFAVVFIVFGVVTGVLILITCCLIPFVVVFGYVIRRKRIRASSPVFLILICLSSIVGFASTYAWYGKPHPVACGFQPWLLGLSVVSLISALSAKTWRLWRLFSVKAKRGTVISDLHLILLYVLMVAPAVVILIIWTIVSTPTAKMEHRGDADHYVCTTGGFTGKPGGLVFFFILVGYEALVLAFAAFLSIATRNVPSFFNESKLIAISIYNLGILAVVVIPVFLVLQEYNPFAAWIIRTVAILYAFAATITLQFLPKIFGMIVLDRGRDVSLNSVSLGKTEKVSGRVVSSSESESFTLQASASVQ